MNRTETATANGLAANSRSLPSWLKVKLPGGETFRHIKDISARRNLHTVCEEARCPNIAQCWGGGTATFMVMGDACTRGCRFCSVASAARPSLPDPDEPRHLADALAEMNLEYVVITTVCRDDLPDQGAGHIARCLREARARRPDMLLEMLIQDFRGDEKALATVLAARPDVIAHNLETVSRLTPLVRDAKASYEQSLEVLRTSKRLSPQIRTKSSLMLGLGETEAEVLTACKDLRASGVEMLTLGQYLRPTGAARHLPVVDFAAPETFERLGQTARAMGFLYVASGPFVRSSYRAGELFLKGLLRNAPQHDL
ncbi:MAG: lipoyl synthase [Elusimicrobia bacterium RIFCSPHIGHO2_02_FULL_57_9]|nr:MAG: lipoyl synthase [Elusimicrobia bacterium RIFCSPHIGHO2_02_FULL_57_9]